MLLEKKLLAASLLYHHIFTSFLWVLFIVLVCFLYVVVQYYILHGMS